MVLLEFAGAMEAIVAFNNLDALSIFLEFGGTIEPLWSYLSPTFKWDC
jgi:hypothetical protein